MREIKKGDICIINTNDNWQKEKGVTKGTIVRVIEAAIKDVYNSFHLVNYITNDQFLIEYNKAGPFHKYGELSLISEKELPAIKILYDKN